MARDPPGRQVGTGVRAGLGGRCWRGRRRAAEAGGGGRLGPEFFEERPPEHFAREAARMAVTLLGAKEAPAGPMPVVLAPGLRAVIRPPCVYGDVK